MSKPTAKKRKADEKEKKTVVIIDDVSEDEEEDWDLKMEDDIDEMVLSLFYRAEKGDLNLYYHLVNFIDTCSNRPASDEQCYHTQLDEYKTALPGDRNILIASIMKAIIFSETTDELKKSLRSLISD